MHRPTAQLANLVCCRTAAGLDRIAVMPLVPKRRWLRFSIRTLLVAVTIFCVWLGWQVKWISARHSQLKTKYASGIVVGRPAESPWPLAYFAEKSVQYIELVQEERTSKAVRQQVMALKQLFPEAEIAYYDDGYRRHWLNEHGQFETATAPQLQQ
jgi:hypothetical protein